MVKVAGDLDGLAFLTLNQLKDVLLGLLDGSRLTSDLHLTTGSTSGSLLRDIELDVELRLQGTTRLATTTNKQTVLVRRNLDGLSCLVL